MSAAPKLLVDIGNTRLKWALLDGSGAFGDCGVAVHGGDPAATLPDLAPLQPSEIWIAHVTGAEQGARLHAAARERYGCDPHHARSAEGWRGLKSAYVEPERLGVDRWLALVAAWAQQRGASCVVGAGTALTVDAVDADGRHLGGIIVAGLDTQQRALLGNTRFGTRRRKRRYHGGLGDDTESCVMQGAALACLGAIDRACAAAGSGARRLITGGDAAILLPHLGAGWEHRPQLVLEGLRALATDR
jgi:type III pantothenate kinase